MSTNYITVNRNDYNRRINEAYSRGSKESQKKIAKIQADAKAKQQQLTKAYESQINNLVKSQNSTNQEIRDLKKKEIELAKQLGQANLTKQEVKKLQEEIKTIQDKQTKFYNDYTKQISDTKQRASVYMNQDLELIKHLQELEVQRYFPDDIEDHIKQIAVAREDIKNGNYEAALAVSQVRFQDLSRLLAQTLIRNSIFQSLKKEVAKALGDMETKIADSETREISYQLDDQTIKDVCDVDFWSYGDYNKIKQAVNILKERFEKLAPNANEKELEKILEQIIQNRNQLDEVVKKATNELIHTHILEDSANSMHQELIENGWSFEKVEQENRRDPSVLHYTDGNDNQLTIVCATGENNDDANIILDVHGDVSEETRQQLKEGVVERIFDQDKVKSVKQAKECAKTASEFQKQAVEQIKRERQH